MYHDEVKPMNYKSIINTISKQLQLKSIEEIRVNTRYATYRATLPSNKQVFLKTSLAKELNICLETEAWWNVTVNKLKASGLQLSMRAPKIYFYGPGYLATEYVNGSLLVADKTSISKEQAMESQNEMVDF